MKKFPCAGCGTMINEDEVIWATHEGKITVLQSGSVPWCDTCLPQERNTNCLADMRCPKCRSLGPFNIVTECVMMWTDNGSMDYFDCDFNQDSHIRCLHCDKDGIVNDFTEDK